MMPVEQCAIASTVAPSRMPSWPEIIRWIDDNRIRDVAAIVSAVVTVLGFAVTLWKVAQSKEAAKRAEEAALAAKNSLRFLDSILEVSAAIAQLEEIKRMHRTATTWPQLPERYSVLRKTLLTIHIAMPDIKPTHSTAIQAVLTNLREIERQVDRASATREGDKKGRLDIAKLNGRISTDLDNLIVILGELRRDRERA